MKIRIILLSVLVCAFKYVNSLENSDLELKLVQVLFRHGARTVDTNEFEIYHYTNSSVYASWGWGELINKGKRTEYNIGVMLRKRYSKYLSPVWKSKDIYAYSSDVDRTKMSLELALAGLYPLIPETTWKRLIEWQPIPYFFVPPDLDVLLQPTHHFDSLVHKVEETKKFKDKLAPFTKFLNFVGKKTGVNCTDLYKASRVYQVITCNEAMGLPVPNWYTPKVKDKFRKFLDLYYDLLVFTKKLKKLVIGPLIKQFIENMNIHNTKYNPRKIYLYSGHDTDISAFTRAHGIKELPIPDFGCTVILEKFQDKNKKIYVRMLGHQGFGSLMVLPLCGKKEFCPINEYLNLINYVIPTDKEIDEIISYQFKCSSDNLRKLYSSQNGIKDVFSKI